MVSEAKKKAPRRARSAVLTVPERSGWGEGFSNKVKATFQRAASTESVIGPAEWEVRKWRRLARKRRREQGRKRAPCGYVGLEGWGQQVWAGPEILGKGCSSGGRRRRVRL